MSSDIRRSASSGPLSSLSYTPRVLVVGAGSGAAFASAEAAAAHGAELILCDTDWNALSRAADKLGAYSLFCDAICETSVDHLATTIADLFPRVDVLINGAGQGYVRTLAMMRTTRALLPMLGRAGGLGLIVNIAPRRPATSCPLAPYASTRKAFEQLSAGLRMRAAGSFIDVVAIGDRDEAGVAEEVLAQIGCRWGVVEQVSDRRRRA